MIRQTRTARLQIERLLDHFLEHDKIRAAELLIAAVRRAYATIEADPGLGAPFPRPYPEVARWQFLWIKEHRYWFGYRGLRDPIVTNVLFDTADIPNSIAENDDEIPIDW